MNINPSQFAFYLKSSSLSSAEQRALLSRLPNMKESEIKILLERLKADHHSMSETLQSAHVERQNIKEDLAEELKSDKES